MGTPLETNTIELQEILSKINALPDGGSEDLSSEITEYSNLNTELEETIDGLPTAGGGGSGGAVETCTVAVNTDGSGTLHDWIATVATDAGEVYVARFNTSSTINNCVCGSCIFICFGATEPAARITGGATVLGLTPFGNTVIQAPTQAGAIATITLYEGM